MPDKQIDVNLEMDSGEGDQLRQPTQTRMAVIENWVNLADNLGISRSIAQIYGLLYTSDRPLNAQDCANMLRISRSSAGQGLRTLKEFGAIITTFELGTRSEHFIIEPDLGVLIQNVISGRLFPAFSKFFMNINEIAETDQSDLTPFLSDRLDKLKRWQSKVEMVKKIQSLI